MIDPELIKQANNQIQSVQNINQQKKEVVDNSRCLLNILMTKDEKNSLKAWCSKHDISMNLFVKMAIDDLQSDIDAGKKTVSKLGVKTI